MIEVTVRDASNKELRTISLAETVFGRPMRTDLLAMAVNWQMNKRRGGCASTKGRAEVHGGGKKPYRQKGTGRARQGTIRAPQFRGGGIVFGPHPRDFATKLPKKVRRLALQVALSAKREAGEMIVVDDLNLREIKTKAMMGLLQGLHAAERTLIVIPEANDIIELSARNLRGVSVLRSEGVNVYDLLVHDTVVITEPALKKLEERLA